MFRLYHKLTEMFDSQSDDCIIDNYQHDEASSGTLQHKFTTLRLCMSIFLFYFIYNDCLLTMNGTTLFVLSLLMVLCYAEEWIFTGKIKKTCIG